MCLIVSVNVTNSITLIVTANNPPHETFAIVRIIVTVSEQCCTEWVISFEV